MTYHVDECAQHDPRNSYNADDKSGHVAVDQPKGDTDWDAVSLAVTMLEEERWCHCDSNKSTLC